MSEEWKQILPKVGLGLAVIGAGYMIYKATQGAAEEEEKTPEGKQADPLEVQQLEAVVTEIGSIGAAPVEEEAEDEPSKGAVNMITAAMISVNKSMEAVIKKHEEDRLAAEAVAQEARAEQEAAELEIQKEALAHEKANAAKDAAAAIKANAAKAAALKKKNEAEEKEKKAREAAAAAQKAKEAAEKKKAEQQRVEKAAADAKAKAATEAAAKAKKDKEAAAAVVAAAAKAKADAEAAAAAKAKADAEAAEAKRLTNPEGTLTLTVQHAKLLIDTDVFGTMDPYVVFSIKDEKNKVIWTQKTKAHIGGGQAPKWNEKFDIDVKNNNNKVFFECFEKDTGVTDDFIGEGSFQPIEFQKEITTREFHRGYAKDKKETMQLWLQGVWTPKA